MYFLLLFLFIVAMFAVVLFFEPLRITFFLDTDVLDMHVLVRWSPGLGVEARIINNRLFVIIQLFGKKIYEGFKKKGKKTHSFKVIFDFLALSHTQIKVSCGFKEPYITGIFCATVDFARTLIRSADIELEPDFVPNSEYFKIKATTELNIGKTLLKLSKSKLNHEKRRRNYGSNELRQ